MNNQDLNASKRVINQYRQAAAVRPLSGKQLAYIAGFMDARASITCNITSKKKSTLLWRIRISGNDKPQIKHIYNLLGIGRINTTNNRTILTIGISEGVGLARLILPLLSIKWRQFSIIIDYVDNIISGNHIDNNKVARLMSDLNQSIYGRIIDIKDNDSIVGYISGLWDGNGTVCLVRGRPIIALYNTVLEPLIMIKQLMGGQLIKPKKRLAKNNQLYMLRWSTWKMANTFYNILFSDSRKARRLYKMCIAHQAISNQSPNRATA